MLAAMAGYSGTPLAKKLGIKSGHVVGLSGAPEGFEALLAGLPEDAILERGVQKRGPYDVLIAFVTSRAELAKKLAVLRPKLAEHGGLWFAWPKKSSGVVSDMTEDAVRAAALAMDLVDNKVCAIDETWSGLRLVVRLEHRKKGEKVALAPAKARR